VTYVETAYPSYYHPVARTAASATAGFVAGAATAYGVNWATGSVYYGAGPVQSAYNQEQRQEYAGEAREDWQDYGKGKQEDWQEHSANQQQQRQNAANKNQDQRQDAANKNQAQRQDAAADSQAQRGAKPSAEAE
jgi:hypothetical protein